MSCAFPLFYSRLLKKSIDDSVHAAELVVLRQNQAPHAEVSVARGLGRLNCAPAVLVGVGPLLAEGRGVPVRAGGSSEGRPLYRIAEHLHMYFTKQIAALRIRAVLLLVRAVLLLDLVTLRRHDVRDAGALVVESSAYAESAR